MCLSSWRGNVLLKQDLGTNLLVLMGRSSPAMKWGFQPCPKCWMSSHSTLWFMHFLPLPTKTKQIPKLPRNTSSTLQWRKISSQAQFNPKAASNTLLSEPPPLCKLEFSRSPRCQERPWPLLQRFLVTNPPHWAGIRQQGAPRCSSCLIAMTTPIQKQNEPARIENSALPELTTKISQ